MQSQLSSTLVWCPADDTGESIDACSWTQGQNCSIERYKAQQVGFYLPSLHRVLHRATTFIVSNLSLVLSSSASRLWPSGSLYVTVLVHDLALST